MHKLHKRANGQRPGPLCRDAEHESTASSFMSSRETVLYQAADLSIALAPPHAARNRIGRLVQRRYAWRGYRLSGGEPLYDPNARITLVAATGPQAFGTLTVGMEGTAGLQADELYREEMNAIRAARLVICEFTRLAVDPEYGTKESLAALFHVAFLYASAVRGCDEIVIEVNPRHVPFYERMLGFVEAGPERVCPRVSAPAVLLRLSCSHAAAEIARCGGHRQGARSLYPYFLGPREAEAVLRRTLAAGLHDPQAGGPGRGAAAASAAKLAA
jgi:hypothetical protein